MRTNSVRLRGSPLWPGFVVGLSSFIAPVRIGALNRSYTKRAQSAMRGCSRVSATITTDEIAQVVTDELKFGNITSMTRSGSSGWAVTHMITTDKGKRLFAKVSREDVEMFEGEKESLRAMFDTHTIRVPEVYHCGRLKGVNGSFIVMEYLDLYSVFSQALLGENLARMHLAEPTIDEARQGKFGFVIDNTIGPTAQPNGWMDDWVEFFRERRLRHQLMLTNDSNLIRKGNELCSRLDELFEDVRGTIKPSILHGDLWSGNVNGVGGSSEPVIYDPASYFGHHEAEFGMSWCMELSSAFWKSYRKLIPEAEGFKRRRKLYQLYHYLNHFNVFGGSYYNVSELMIDQLLKGLN